MCISRMAPSSAGGKTTKSTVCCCNETQKQIVREQQQGLHNHESALSVVEENEEGESSSIIMGQRFTTQERNHRNRPLPSNYLRRSDIVTSTQLLGKGAFANVYEVNSIRLQQRDDVDSNETSTSPSSSLASGGRPSSQCCYVIKQLRESLLDDPYEFQMAVSCLAAEAEFLSKLNHPNILRLRGKAVFDLGNFSAGGRGMDHFLVLDKLDETLSQRLERWKKGEGLIPTTYGQPNPKLNCAYQIALALEYLHDRNIIYRDLKPDNIGFKISVGDGGGDTVQLFDFGLSRELPQTISSNPQDDFFDMSGAGTRRYMAPEVVLRKPYNATADVYGWSMVLYQILSLQKPYARYNRKVHCDKVCNGGERPSLYEHWPKALTNLLEESWEGIPRIRLTSREVVERLRSLLFLSIEDTSAPVERSVLVIRDLASLFNDAPLAPTNTTPLSG